MLVAKIIDGIEIARGIRNEVAVGVKEMRSKHDVQPGLAVILAGNNPASAVYVRNKEKSALEVGIYGESFRLPEDVSEREVTDLVHRLNNDGRYHGILVQLPLPPHISENRVVEAINPLKDVDGLHPYNIGLLVGGRPLFVPATPAGIQQLLIRAGYDPDGKHVVVCGRSNIVGKPVSNLLMQRLVGSNATVTVCHSRTSDISNITRQADILIVAIGKPLFVTAEMVKEKTVVIDVGINRLEDPQKRRGYRLVGDVDYDSVHVKVEAITPVPGGVGPLTIAMLLQNTLKAARISVHPDIR